MQSSEFCDVPCGCLSFLKRYGLQRLQVPASSASFWSDKQVLRSDVCCMSGRAGCMSHTSACEIRVAAVCSSQLKVGAALARSWFFSSFSFLLPFSFRNFLNLIQHCSRILVYSMIAHHVEYAFGFWVLPGASFTSSVMAALICCSGVGKTFSSGWLLQVRVLLQDIQAHSYLPKRSGSFRQALDKQSEIWGGLSDTIF